jgi:hypothetical protein
LQDLDVGFEYLMVALHLLGPILFCAMLVRQPGRVALHLYHPAYHFVLVTSIGVHPLYVHVLIVVV